ncbi:hypothetical protein P3T37_006110 [Kitasatospora sp. MAA4]|nr:hypothetical protein [Kitasatospora sp. MAA4]
MCSPGNEEGALEPLGPSLVQNVIEAYRAACARSTVYQGWLERHDSAAAPPQLRGHYLYRSGRPKVWEVSWSATL